MRVTREMLWSYNAGSLDPAEMAAIGRWIEAKPSRRAEVEALRPPVQPTPDLVAWTMPPPGYGWPGRIGATPVLGQRQVEEDAVACLGDWFRITAARLGDAADRELFLLQRRRNSWVRVAPDHDNNRVPVSQLADDSDGNHCVDLMARGPIGEQRWAVAFPLSHTVDARPWPPDDWLRDQIASGALPVVSVTVDIRAD